MLFFLLFACPFLVYLVLADATERELIYIGAVREKWIPSWGNAAVHALGLLSNAAWQSEHYAKWPNTMWINCVALALLLLSWWCFWCAHEFPAAGAISVLGSIVATIQLIVKTDGLTAVWIIYHGYNALSLVGFAHLFRRLAFDTRILGRI